MAGPSVLEKEAIRVHDAMICRRTGIIHLSADAILGFIALSAWKYLFWLRELTRKVVMLWKELL